MPKEMNRSLQLIAKKATSIVAAASLLSGLFNLGSVLPVSAQQGVASYYEPATFTMQGVTTATGVLSNLSSVLSNPTLGAEYSNVSYYFRLSDGLSLITTSSAYIKITLNDDASGSNGTMESWSGTWDPTDVDNITLSASFEDAGIVMDAANNMWVDSDSDNTNDSLLIKLDCDTANNPNGCILPYVDGSNNSIDYGVDLINLPLITPANESQAGNYQSYVSALSIYTEEVPGTQIGESKQTVNNYGTPLTITANVDARLKFSVSGLSADAYTAKFGSSLESSSTGCNLGKMIPGLPVVCIWKINVSTNAPGGFDVFVRQDQNMSFNGSSFLQFPNGNPAVPDDQTQWTSPSTASKGHLGYTSYDNSLSLTPFVNTLYFAGIPDLLDSNVSASSGVGQNDEAGLVARSTIAGNSGDIFYGIRAETATTMPQAAGELNQSYTHNQYFIVIGRF